MDDYLGIAVQIKVDYDVGKWVMIPPSEVMTPEEWASRTAHSWAKDLGREHDSNWPQVLEKMLLRGARAPGEERWDVRLIHIDARSGEGPWVSGVNLGMSMPEETPDGLAKGLSDPDDPELLEPPIAEPIDLHPGIMATRVVRYVKGENPDSVMATLYVTWRAHTHADLTLVSGSYDIGRLLAIRDDVVDLARATSLVPIDEEPA